MSEYIINGGKRITGEMRIQGAKNSVLPILAAAFLVSGESVIHNCPDITDVDASVKILEHLGCKVKREGHTVTVDSTSADRWDIPEALMREMRSSVVFLGAIIGRTGRAELSAPGGCEIGLRPIDIHLDAIKKFGVNVDENASEIVFSTGKRLCGASVSLSFPSVGATENIMLTACTAKGRTVITNAAREPEISDLADFLNRCGARISGAGEGIITVDGVERLHSAEHTVIPDRIAAATYMTAAAVTHGRLRLDGVIPAHLISVLHIFAEAGCDIDISGNSVTVSAPPVLNPVKTVRTMPYPGFPTDMQPQIMTMMSLCRGTGVIIETIFESRYKHVSELCRLGAKIRVDGRMAVTEGVEGLTGGNVVAADLRGGSALVIAGLAANGTTVVENTHFTDRGYENMQGCLALLGGDIRKG